jgi:hypothetical protein
MALGTFRYFSQDPVGSWRWRRSSTPPGPWLRAPPARDLRKHRQPLRCAVRGGSNRLRTWRPQFRCECRAATRPRGAEYVTGTQVGDNGSSVNYMHLHTQAIHMPDLGGDDSLFQGKQTAGNLR